MVSSYLSGSTELQAIIRKSKLSEKLDIIYQYQLESQLLHAYRLSMPEHMKGLEQISGKVFTAPLPKKFSDILERESIKE